jgi:hypothetical protein
LKKKAFNEKQNGYCDKKAEINLLHFLFLFSVPEAASSFAAGLVSFVFKLSSFFIKFQNLLLVLSTLKMSKHFSGVEHKVIQKFAHWSELM